MHNWNVFEHFEQASEAAAEFLYEQIRTVLAIKPKCHIALPGGNTPAKCLSYLVQKDLPWEKIAWYLGDERCYPEAHEERNDVMLQRNLWAHLKAPEVYRIPAELGAEQAADAYRQVIDSISRLDIAFLGMGEDGHTASLFPGNPGLQDARSVIPVFDSPKPPSERVSLSVSTLQQAGIRLVLVSGAAKADIIRQIRGDEPLPINTIGDINWFVDQDCFIP